jgi:hypothetical protein
VLFLLVGMAFFHLILFSGGLRLYSERSHKINKDRYETLRKPVNLLIIAFLVTNLFLILFKGTPLYAGALYLYVVLLFIAAVTLLFVINLYYSKMHADAGGFNTILLFTSITLVLYAALIIIEGKDDMFLRLISTFEGALLLFSFALDLRRSAKAAKEYKKSEVIKQIEKHAKSIESKAQKNTAIKKSSVKKKTDKKRNKKK